MAPASRRFYLSTLSVDSATYELYYIGVLVRCTYKRDMAKPKERSGGVERVTLKLPKQVAVYFRKAFPHGKRSDFVAECIRRYQRDQEIRVIEDELRTVRRS